MKNRFIFSFLFLLWICDYCCWWRGEDSISFPSFSDFSYVRNTCSIAAHHTIQQYTSSYIQYLKYIYIYIYKKISIQVGLVLVNPGEFEERTKAPRCYHAEHLCTDPQKKVRGFIHIIAPCTILETPIITSSDFLPRVLVEFSALSCSSVNNGIQFCVCRPLVRVFIGF